MNKETLRNLEEGPATCGRHVSYLYRKSCSILALRLKEYGISPIQSIVLVGVFRYSGLNQQALAEGISMAPGVVSRILRELEDSGYVEKMRDEQNRRNYNLFLTPTGESLVVKSLTMQGAYWNSLLTGFSAEEVALLNRLLKQMELRAYSTVAVKQDDD